MAGVRQGGSILNFIIVAVVLVGLLAAGIYVVRQVTQEPSEGVIVATDETTEQPKEEQVSQEGNAEERPAQNLPGSEESSVEVLPQTGPAETISGALAVGVLSLAMVYYLRSRRAELSL